MNSKLRNLGECFKKLSFRFRIGTTRRLASFFGLVSLLFFIYVLLVLFTDFFMIKNAI